MHNPGLMSRVEWTEQQAVAQARGGDPEAFRALAFFEDVLR